MTASELERITGHTEGQMPPGICVTVGMDCDKHAERTLERIKAVMERVAVHSRTNWPTERQWLELLPPWFLASFLDDPPEQVRFPDPWSLGSWLESMRARTWQWWSSLREGHAWCVLLLLAEWPCSTEAFEWLAAVAAESDAVIVHEVLDFEFKPDFDQTESEAENTVE